MRWRRQIQAVHSHSDYRRKSQASYGHWLQGDALRHDTTRPLSHSQNFLSPSEVILGSIHGTLWSTTLVTLSRREIYLAWLLLRYTVVIYYNHFFLCYWLFLVSNLEFFQKFLSILLICEILEYLLFTFWKLKHLPLRPLAVLLFFLVLFYTLGFRRPLKLGPVEESSVGERPIILRKVGSLMTREKLEQLGKSRNKGSLVGSPSFLPLLLLPAYVYSFLSPKASSEFLQPHNFSFDMAAQSWLHMTVTSSTYDQLDLPLVTGQQHRWLIFLSLTPKAWIWPTYERGPLWEHHLLWPGTGRTSPRASTAHRWVGRGRISEQGRGSAGMPKYFSNAINSARLQNKVGGECTFQYCRMQFTSAWKHSSKELTVFLCKLDFSVSSSNFKTVSGMFLLPLHHVMLFGTSFGLTQIFILFLS